MRWLLGIDIHDCPEGLLEAVARWATAANATVDLVYADDTPDALQYITEPAVVRAVTDARNRWIEVHADKLAEVHGQLPEAIRGARIHSLGPPDTVLLEHAPDYDAIVVATHGRKGLNRLWLGSVAERIVRESPVPVLTLRLGS
jgi:nucleotide-binding universal stress UspA family protein